ncbi:hypothetical protein [Advenella sp. FME57]|uniref:hypothetical protein n=1 Tax=Advenella sp. FME57 TaxID=2742604 RepID=UPI00186751BF|nr:hypothetical protein [Advenella sp. FME57]
MKPEIILHLGVHKTATTHIQSRLLNSQEKLSKERIQYIKLEDLRKSLTHKLSTNAQEEVLLEGLLPYMLCDKLVISDENIIGGTNKPDSNKIYSKAIPRLGKLVAALNGYKIITHITLRDYVDYFISRYCESLRHFKYCDFDDYYEMVEFDKVSWIDLLHDIRSVGCENIVISEFNDVIQNNDKYLANLLGVNAPFAQATESGGVRRSKMSLEAIQILGLINESFPPQMTRKVAYLIDNFKQAGVSTPFNPFPKEVFERLKDNYTNHLNSLMN